MCRLQILAKITLMTSQRHDIIRVISSDIIQLFFTLLSARCAEKTARSVCNRWTAPLRTFPSVQTGEAAGV